MNNFRVKDKDGHITTEIYFLPLICYVNRITVQINPSLEQSTTMTNVNVMRGITIGWLIWTWFISFPKWKKLPKKIIDLIMKED